MQIEVAKLEGKELNYWVQRALGWKHLGAIGFKTPEEGFPYCLSDQNDWWEDPDGNKICGPCGCYPQSFAEDWALAGPIIEREGIDIGRSVTGKCYSKIGLCDRGMATFGNGPTQLVAAMRCFVASKFGEQIEEAKP